MEWVVPQKLPFHGQTHVAKLYFRPNERRGHLGDLGVDGRIIMK